MARLSDTLDLSGGDLVRPCRSFRITTSGFSSGATATVTVGDLEANDIIEGASIECETAATFSAGTTTGFTATLGITGTLAGVLASAAMGSLTAGQHSDLGGPGTLVGRLRASTALVLTITPTGGTPDADEISGGAYWVHVYVSKPKDRVA